MDDLKNSILDAALSEAVFDGFTDSLPAKAAEAAGFTAFDGKRAFPDGVAELLDFFSARSDARMIENLARDHAMARLKIRERIATAVMVRLRENTPHREAIRRMLHYYAKPWHAPAALKNLYATVDAMWYAAGDTSTDYNFYTKRLLLAEVYATTTAKWLRDHSADLAETEAFLARRIEEVMTIEKLKAKMKTALRPLHTAP